MKPLCELCGDRHDSHQAHKFATNAVPNPVPNSVPNVANKSVEYLRVKLWKQANRERYNESQRELMKRRRAKAKEKSNEKAD